MYTSIFPAQIAFRQNPKWILKTIPILLFLSTIIPLQVNAQLPALSGIVRSAVDSLALEGANVVLAPGNAGVTDPEGRFVLIDPMPGMYDLVISYMGFETKIIPVTIGVNGLALGDIYMQVYRMPLPPLKVASSPLKPYNYIESKVIAAEIEQASARDLGEYMRGIPNVAGIRKGGTGIDPVIRGFRFHQLNVRVDGGIRIEGGCPNRMDPTASHIPVDDIEMIEIVRGPFAIKDGLPFGGYVHFITSSPKPFPTKKFEVSGKLIKGYESNWNGHREHFTLKGGNNRLFFNITGNRMDYGSYSDGDGNIVPSKFLKYSYATELGFIPAKNHMITLTYNEHHNRDSYFPALPMDERIDDTQLFAVNYMGKMISKRVKFVKAKAFRSNVFHEMDNKERPFSDTTISISRVDAITQGFGAGIGLTAGKKGTLIVGAGYENTFKDGNRQKIYVGQYPSQGLVPTLNENLMYATIGNAGAFMEYTGTSSWFDIAAALRVDYNTAHSDDSLQIIHDGVSYYDYTDTETSFLNLSFSVGIDKRFSDYYSMGLSVGRGVRSPNMIERFMKFLPVGYDNFDYLGNPHIRPEANHELDLSARYHNSSYGTLELTGFYSLVMDYISSRVLPPTVTLSRSADVIGVKYFVNIDRVHLSGLEFSYASPTKYPLQLQAFASYTQGLTPIGYGYSTDAGGIPTGVVEVENDPLPEIAPFEANIKLSYRMLDGRLVPRMGLRMVAAQRRVSVAWNELESPGFSLVDVGVSYRYNHFISLAAGVNNLLDESYYEHLNRRIIGVNNCETCRGLNIYEPGRVIYANLIIQF